MRTQLVSLILLFVFNSLQAQIAVEWAKSFGKFSNEELGAMISLPDGNVLMAGNREVSQEDQELLLYNINQAGEVVWEKSILYSDVSLSISDIIPSSSDNSFILIGNYKIRVEDSNGFDIGNEDYLVMKIDDLGNLLWSRTYGGSEDDELISIVDSGNGYILAGDSESSDNDVIDHIGEEDFWLVWIDYDGGIIKSKSYGGAFEERLSSMILTNDNNLLLSGYTRTFTNDNTAFADLWILKTNLDGETTWSKSHGGTSVEFSPVAIEVENNEFILASYSASNDFDIPMDNNGAFDFFVYRMNQSGNIIWAKSYGGSEHDIPISISKATENSLFLAGFTSSDDGDVSNGFNGGQTDYWLIQINKDNGALMWEDNFGGSGSDYLADILVQDDNLYLGGRSFSNDIDISGDNNGSYDFWVVNLKGIISSVYNISNKKLELFPNPCKGNLILNSDSEFKNYLIYNILGCPVLSGEIIDSEVNIESIAPGNYLIQVFDSKGERFESTKFIKI